MTDNDTHYGRRRVLAGFGGFVALGSLAGCGGIGGGSGGGGNGGGSGNGGGNGGSGGSGNGGGGNGGGSNGGGGNGGGSGNGGGGTASGSQVWQPFDFSQPGTFEYEIRAQGGQSGTMTWQIKSVSGSEATVSIEASLGQLSTDQTITGTPEQIRNQLMGTPAAAFLAPTFFAPALTQAEGEKFAPGNGWTVQTQQGTASMTITGSETRAGLSCMAWEYTIDGTKHMEGCVNMEYSMVLYIETYDPQSGDSTYRVELTNFKPG